MLTISQFVTASIPQWTIRAALLASMDGRTIIEMPGLDKRPRRAGRGSILNGRARGRRTSGEVGKVGRYHRIKRRRQQRARRRWYPLHFGPAKVLSLSEFFAAVAPQDWQAIRLIMPSNLPPEVCALAASYGFVESSDGS